jgi:hypothetical protein
MAVTAPAAIHFRRPATYRIAVVSDFYRRAQIGLQQESTPQSIRSARKVVCKKSSAEFHPASATPPQVKEPRQIKDDGKFAETRAEPQGHI